MCSPTQLTVGMKPKQPTIEDVASLADVSRQTVSRVVNDSGYVADETRSRVEAAIDDLDYKPNAVARSMATGHTCTLGCVSPSLIDYTFASIIDSAQAEARRQGYFVLAASAPTANDVAPLLEEMLHRRVDGLIVLNPRADSRYHHLLPLIEHHMPIVYVSDTPCHEPVSSVRCDDRDGGYQATNYLLDLGHRAIATILGPENEKCSADRLEGYRQALTEADVPFDPTLTIRGDWSATSGHEASQRLLQIAPHFSAVFAQNDRMAVGAIHALREASYRVPEDVSMVGFDDMPLASHFDPPLTTLRQPMEETGCRAAQLLISTIEDPGRPPEHIQSQARLVERASCAVRPSKYG